MHLVHTRRTAPASREMATRVRELAEGGESVFDKANLRPSDETWWVETTKHIADSIDDDVFVRGASDAELISRIPESAYKHCYGQSDRNKVTQDQLTVIRKGGAWVFPLGCLMRDTERILLESIHMGDKVIRARSQLRAFAWVIASETGYAKIVHEVGRGEPEST